MNLTKYSLNDLLLNAIQSEIESKELYTKLSERVKNVILKDRLKFLASEEEKHKILLEDTYRKKFNKEAGNLPPNSDVPIPSIDVNVETDMVSDIIRKAMDAELTAKDFYESLGVLIDNQELSAMLNILANMENQHYKILQSEYENAKKFEDYDEMWGMMHVGP